jgi:hypothetical protein
MLRASLLTPNEFLEILKMAVVWVVAQCKVTSVSDVRTASTKAIALMTEAATSAETSVNFCRADYTAPRTQ